MKSTAVYRTLREVVGPWCKTNGFRRTTGGMLGWYAPEADEWSVMWFQCSQDGFDAYAGSKLTFELQLGGDYRIGAWPYRRRFPALLEERTRARVRAMQNEVIARLPRPPAEHVALFGDKVAACYLSQFEAVAAYAPNDDIWLRHHSEDDVRRWGEFLLPQLPVLIERFTAEQGT